MKIQKAVRRETEKVALGVAIMTALMLGILFALHLVFPGKLGFSLGTVVSALLGADLRCSMLRAWRIPKRRSVSCRNPM